MVMFDNLSTYSMTITKNNSVSTESLLKQRYPNSFSTKDISDFSESLNKE